MEITLLKTNNDPATESLPGRWVDSISYAEWDIVADVGAVSLTGTADLTTEGYRDFKTGVTWQTKTWVLDFGDGTITVVAYMKGKISGWCGRFQSTAPLCTRTNFVPNCNWYITDGIGIYENLRGYGKYDLETGVHVGTGYYITD